MNDVFGRAPFGGRPFMAGEGPLDDAKPHKSTDGPDVEPTDYRQLTTLEAQMARYHDLMDRGLSPEEAMRATGMAQEDLPPARDPSILARPEDQI